MKQVILILLTSILMGCDKSVQLNINEDVVYPLDNPCGRIEFRASTFSSGITVYQQFKSGEYKLNLDSLAVSIQPPSAGSIESVGIYDEQGDEILQNQIQVVSEDRINLHINFDRAIHSINGVLLYYPVPILRVIISL